MSTDPKQPDVQAQETEWTSDDTAGFLAAIKDYPIKTEDDAEFIAAKIRELTPALNRQPYISSAAYETLEDFSRADYTYGENIRLAATQVLIDYGLDHEDKGRKVLESLKLSLIDRNPVLRRKAVTGIGEIGFSNESLGNNAADLLLEIVQDMDAEVVTAAVQWAGNIGDTQPRNENKSLQALEHVIRNSGEIDAVTKAVKWAGTIGLTTEQRINPAVETLAAIIDQANAHVTPLGGYAVSGLGSIAKRNEDYAAQTLPVLVKAFEVQGSQDLHIKAAETIWQIGAQYPNLKNQSIQLLEQAIIDNYSATTAIGYQGASELIASMQWNEFPGAALREIFEGHAKGEKNGHYQAASLVEQLRGSQRDYIDSLSPKSRNGRSPD